MPQRIRVVDDNADVRDIVCCTLETSGYEAIPASGGKHAEEQILNPCPGNPTKEKPCPRT